MPVENIPNDDIVNMINNSEKTALDRKYIIQRAIDTMPADEKSKYNDVLIAIAALDLEE